MGLQKKIPVPSFGDAAIDDGAILRIRGAVGVLFPGWKKPGVVAFPDSEAGQDQPLRSSEKTDVAENYAIVK